MISYNCDSLPKDAASRRQEKENVLLHLLYQEKNSPRFIMSIICTSMFELMENIVTTHYEFFSV